MCMYCEYSKDDYICALDKNGHVAIDLLNNIIRVRYFRNNFSFDISYCPKCGRNLKEKEK